MPSSITGFYQFCPTGGACTSFTPGKKLSRAETYIDIDVSIYDYLQELERCGEGIEDYESIWYYF